MYVSYHKHPLEVDRECQGAHLILPGLLSASLTDRARLLAIFYLSDINLFENEHNVLGLSPRGYLFVTQRRVPSVEQL